MKNILITGGAGSTAFTSVGLLNGETIGSVTIAYGNGAAANKDVATYTNQVTASAATGGTFAPGNYTISYEAGDIIVGKANLAVTAGDVLRFEVAGPSRDLADGISWAPTIAYIG